MCRPGGNCWSPCLGKPVLLWVLLVLLTPRLPSCGAQSTVEIRSVPELRNALANPSVSTIQLPALLDLKLTEDEWPASSVVTIAGRAVTVEGATQSPDSFPVIDFNFLPSRVKLIGGNLTFRRTFHLQMRLVPPQGAPGYDLIQSVDDATATAAGISVLTIQNGYHINLAGADNAFYTDPNSIAALQTVRPAAFPGQTSLTAPDPNEPRPCRKASKKYAAQCWPLETLLHIQSFVLTALDSSTGKPAGYYIQWDHTDFLRHVIIPTSCIVTRSFDNCIAKYEAANARMPLLAPAPESSKITETNILVIVLPCVLGGLLLIAALALGLLLYRRYRNRQQQQPLQEQQQKDVEKAVTPEPAATGMATGTTHTTGTIGTSTGSRALDSGSQQGAEEGKAPHILVINKRVSVVSDASAETNETNTCSGLLTFMSSPKDSDMAGGAGGSGSLQSVHALWETALAAGGGAERLTDLVIGVDVQVDRDKVIGQGWCGCVMEGMYAGQRVAVKQLHAIQVKSEVALHAMQHEVEVLSRLNHRNVVRLLGAGLTAPEPFLVMELMGPSLHAVMHSEPPCLLPLDQVLQVAIDIASGLAYLHPFIIHRDLKPENVLLDAEATVAKLTDFGLARIVASSAAHTDHPELGTAPYMAPECFDRSCTAISWHSDIYSLGVVISEMLTGRRPWSGMAPMQIAVAVTIHNLRPPVPDDEARCPAPLRKLLLACWARHPKRRPSAAEVAKKLTVILKQLSVSAPIDELK